MQGKRLSGVPRFVLTSLASICVGLTVGFVLGLIFH